MPPNCTSCSFTESAVLSLIREPVTTGSSPLARPCADAVAHVTKATLSRRQPRSEYRLVASNSVRKARIAIALPGARDPGDSGQFATVRTSVHNGDVQASKPTQSWLCDMDGVLISDGRLVAGADLFIERLRKTETPFLVLTNNSLFSPRELSSQLSQMGLELDERELWTSALATARFVQSQHPNGTAFVIGEASMHEALSNVGYSESDRNPDYVVLGETQDYSFDDFATAIGLIERGSRFVATNPEPTGPGPNGSLPGCGAMARLIQSATSIKPYFVGKPNPIMIREALSILGAHSKTSVMVGDRMETDILAGVEAGLATILVLSGVTRDPESSRLPFRPSRIVDSIADLVDEV